MKKQIFGLALVGLVASASAWTVKADAVDEWGLIGTTGISGPDADYGYAGAGGSSQVLDKDGACVGFCGSAAANDPSDDVWKIGGLLNNDRLSMKFKVTAYTTKSASGWGWANAGYMFGPILDETKTDVNLGVLGRSKPMGLTGTSTIYYSIKYTAGKKVNLQLFAAPSADGSPGYETADHGVPRFEITGTGADQAGSKTVSAIKYSWGSGTPDYSKAVGLGFLRIVAAGTQGAAFPATEPQTTDFDFMCVSDEASGCGTPVVGKLGALSFSQDANGINFAGVKKSFSAEVVNSLGQVVKTAEVSAANSAVSTSGLENGVYFVRAAGEVASIVVR